jgi:hypothetical protein
VELPSSSGLVFDRVTGRLYEAAMGQVMVLFPWPEQLSAFSYQPSAVSSASGAGSERRET